jgi:hypothetical protein
LQLQEPDFSQERASDRNIYLDNFENKQKRNVFENSLFSPAANGNYRLAVSLPSDVAFHRSMDHSFAQDLDTFLERNLQAFELGCDSG